MRALILIFSGLLAFVMPASALPTKNHPVPQPVTVDSVQVGCFTDAPSVQITISAATWGYWGPNNLYFYNPAGASTGTHFGSQMQIFNLMSTTGLTYTISTPANGANNGIKSQDFTYTLPDCRRIKSGMTWTHGLTNATTGTITVGCGSTGPNPCDPHNGDTLCSVARPVLCIYKPSPVFQVPVGVSNSDMYNRWSGGVVATTSPIVPSPNYAHLSDVDTLCRTTFGTGWRTAEFHDGWGWNFQAHGGTAAGRFWVNINDQPAGNCWAQ